MDYFSKFLRPGVRASPPKPVDHVTQFHRSWIYIKNTLEHPDERQLRRGIKATDVPMHLQSMVDSLVWESTRTEEGSVTAGACMEYLLKNDVLGILVRLSESDRPSGIQAEVLRAIQNMVVLLDEQFLVQTAVHRAVLRLLRNCVGDDLQDQLDGRGKAMGAAGDALRSQPSEYEEDLVNLLCILCSRIRTYRELLMIFFHDKHWYRSGPLFSVDEEDERDEDEEDEPMPQESASSQRSASPAPSQATIKSAPASSVTKKPEYEFLLFNYLLRFVHREGQIGDFARAGVLFLMDVAMSPGDTTVQPPVVTAGSSSSHSSNTAYTDPAGDSALALAEYILDGDFSDVLGAGLVAVYSLLPTKLEFRQPTAAEENNTLMTIGGLSPETEEEKVSREEEAERSRALGVEDASNPDFKSRLDHFMKLLEFVQDVLRRNSAKETADASLMVGSAIVQSILDAVRRIFLENVLYPSILECSDADGSAVAVMSYIEAIIRTLPEGPLSNILIQFLMSEDNDEVTAKIRRGSTIDFSERRAPQSRTVDKKTKSMRRKSSAMVLLELEAPDTRRQTAYFTSMGRFTLKDLLKSSMKSKSQATATSALQLLQTMLIHHPQICIEMLLIVTRDPHATNFPLPSLVSGGKSSIGGVDDSTEFPSSHDIDADYDISNSSLFYQPVTTYSTHEREMDLYTALISRIDPSHNEDPFSTGYDNYLGDALIAIQSQVAYQADVDVESRKHWKHRLNVNDPIITILLDSLRKFFANTPDFNIALTGVISTLAIHPDRSLAGFVTFSLSENDRSENGLRTVWSDGDDGDDRSIDFEVEERLSSNSIRLPASAMDDRSRPVLYTIFHALVAQLERYRSLVDRFDQFLLERRQGLLFSENLTDALGLVLDIDDLTRTTAASEVPYKTYQPKQKSLVSFFSDLTPKKSKPARPSTPPVTASPRHKSQGLPASPFGHHYQQTSAIVVEPLVAPGLSGSTWTPSQSTKWTPEDEDVFNASWGNKSDSRKHHEVEEAEAEGPAGISLSQLLDNVVILEESIKELVAIIHARRSLGIDSVRYI
ncbi:hypothetical protein FISHEDRAFT_37958 [Fistulina hepatica ATCC 64428]|nr:hypothetical protein FISHEDRAFT_37958 [Fistulina hepatica ATCC 64428]